MKTKIMIDNCQDLFIDMQKYEKRFPDTHTKYETISEIIKRHEEDPPGSVFGIEVASDWEDKCYGFEIDKIIRSVTFIKYVGIWKT